MVLAVPTSLSPSLQGKALKAPPWTGPHAKTEVYASHRRNGTEKSFNTLNATYRCADGLEQLSTHAPLHEHQDHAANRASDLTIPVEVPLRALFVTVVPPAASVALAR